MKEFNSIEEMKPYYDKEKNLFYIEDHIIIKFYLICSWDIVAKDITAGNITARNITAWNITAVDINARDITAVDINVIGDIDAENIVYYAVCFAYNNIKCRSIRGSRGNHKHFVLDGEIIIKEDKNNEI